MSMIRCIECSADISNKASYCPKCGCPIEVTCEAAKRKKKWKKIRFMILLAFLILIIGIIFLVFQNNKQQDAGQYYNGIPWGTDKEKVRAIISLEGKVIEKDNQLTLPIDNFMGMKDVNAVTYYLFDDKKLKEVYTFILNWNMDAYPQSVLIEKFTKEFDELYGEHEESGESYIWNTSKSRIEMSCEPNELFGYQFKDIRTVEEL